MSTVVYVKVKVKFVPVVAVMAHSMRRVIPLLLPKSGTGGRCGISLKLLPLYYLDSTTNDELYST
jgi:hypothetical protein